MASVQRYFEEFHENIRADYEMNQTLREKKDAILTLLRRRLKEAKRPTFDELLQGSYAMGMGIQPIGEIEFDIDVGLRFGFRDTDYLATEVRKWVFDAVDGHTDSVKEKGPCIRVGYSKGYHVDVVAYAHWSEKSGSEEYRLAHRSNGWRPADPPGLLEFVEKARKPFMGTEDSKTKTDQLRRIVRYLKRWYDVAIPFDSEAKPCGLAFVLLSIESFQPTRTWNGQSDDRSALEALANAGANRVGRIVVSKPTPEYEDVFAKISDDDMRALKKQFSTLADILRRAEAEPDPVEACKMLRKVFGDDFPVPDPDETGRKTRSPAIVPSSSSA